MQITHVFCELTMYLPSFHVSLRISFSSYTKVFSMELKLLKNVTKLLNQPSNQLIATACVYMTQIVSGLRSSVLKN